MRRLTATLVAFLSLFLFAMPASAGWEWCESDRVLLLNGTRVQVLVAIPQDQLSRVTGPVTIVVSTPERARRSTVSTDAGFNGHGERVEFADLNDGTGGRGGPFTALIAVQVPVAAGAPVPVRVAVVPENDKSTSRVGTSDGVAVPVRILTRNAGGKDK
jgi:hypothetical protein